MRRGRVIVLVAFLGALVIAAGCGYLVGIGMVQKRPLPTAPDTTARR